jgi:hypothetical protein
MADPLLLGEAKGNNETIDIQPGEQTKDFPLTNSTNN